MSTQQYILDHKLVAVVRLADYDKAVEVTRALIAGGITVLEFTLTGKGAIQAVETVRKAVGDAACVGVGTVLTTEDCQASLDSGAQFVVTPAVRKAVIAACVNRNIPILCGGFTPTELLEAYEAGSELVKLFPAQQGGPRYLKDILAPLPFLKVVPTGGVSAENLRSYLDAGAVGVGIGGNLVSAKAVAANDFAQITTAAQACVAAIQAA
jgi:2-dehydro-3-deoxyphosphogluconate aldolase/(4S)-4-hydroxy-2-oxoglutarate aldolase